MGALNLPATTKKAALRLGVHIIQAKLKHIGIEAVHVAPGTKGKDMMKALKSAADSDLALVIHSKSTWAKRLAHRISGEADFTISDLADGIPEIEHDGGSDTRLFLERRIDVDVSKMSKTEYAKMLKQMEKASLACDGFEVYAWNDCSSYAYWKERGQMNEYNYIQVTAIVHDLTADETEIKDAMDRVMVLLVHWENVTYG